MTTDQNAPSDRFPARIPAAEDFRPLLQFLPDGLPALPADLRAQGSAAGPSPEVHLHYHAAPETPAQPSAPAGPEAGWLLLNRLAPYLIAAALVAFLICGGIAILAYTCSFVMAMLITLIHSLVAMTASVVVLGLVVALVTALVRPLLTGPSVTVQGNKNQVDAASLSRNGAK